jgi:hypothetical protein
MKFENKTDQIYDWLKSIHNMLVGVMMSIGIGIGFFVFYLTDNWLVIPLCCIGSFAFPLAENIRRRIIFKLNIKNNSEKSFTL